MTLRLFDPPEPLAAATFRTNGALIAAVADIWAKDDPRTVDLTYGLGGFWTEWRPVDLTAHDIDPDKGDGVDFRATPHPDDTFDLAIFDPPYVPSNGPTGYDQARFGRLDDASRRPEHYRELARLGLAEATRITRPGGLIWQKTQNYVQARKYQPGMAWALTDGDLLQLEQVDQFFLIRENIVSSSTWKTVEHARNNWSTLIVWRVP